MNITVDAKLSEIIKEVYINAIKQATEKIAITVKHSPDSRDIQITGTLKEEQCQKR